MKKQLIADQTALTRLFGPRFKRKKALEQEFGVRLLIRGHAVILNSPSAARLTRAEKMLTGLLAALESPGEACAADEWAASLENGTAVPHEAGRRVTTGRRSNVYLKTRGQERFFDAVRECDLVFAIGPAGTGKTFLAVAMAIEALRTRQVERLVLVRPAVEAGESLGFLPGNLKEKIDPYLAPLYDALYTILTPEAVSSYFESRVIEVSPLAYMRGRTLNNAFIILDEAQNASPAQMKMFLTRLGPGSKAVVAGDVTQIDLPMEKISGLIEAEELLCKTEGIRFIHFSELDVVRHPLVQDVIRAYNHLDRRKRRDGGRTET